MDIYDRIIRDIQQKTAEEIIRWKVVRPDMYSETLVNPLRVIRLFEADYPMGGKDYVLLFVAKKVEHDSDSWYATEGLEFESLILGDDGQIVISLFDGAVDRDDLLKLSGLIDAHNDRAKDFFAAFDKSVAM